MSVQSAQPLTPGLSFHVQAGTERSSPASIRYTTSCSFAWSVTHSREPSAVPHMPPGACSPLAYTAESALGLPFAGSPEGSMRSTFPAREAGSAVAFALPASPVATKSVPSAPASNAPRLLVDPFGMPVSTGLGACPCAKRTTRLSTGVVM